MALPGDGVQSLGSYFCLIRRRFKRRRTKRSERKGNPWQPRTQPVATGDATPLPLLL